MSSNPNIVDTAVDAAKSLMKAEAGVIGVIDGAINNRTAEQTAAKVEQVRNNIDKIFPSKDQSESK